MDEEKEKLWNLVYEMSAIEGTCKNCRFRHDCDYEWNFCLASEKILEVLKKEL